MLIQPCWQRFLPSVPMQIVSAATWMKIPSLGEKKGLFLPNTHLMEGEAKGDSAFLCSGS